MTELSLAVDVGGSSTKIFYQFDEWKSPKCLLLSPELELISPERFNEYQERKGWIGNPAPSMDAYVKLPDVNNIVVLGNLATKFDPKDRLYELKYENALFKVLSAIGIIVQKHDIQVRGSLKVRLAILLPWNEYTDRTKFEQKLSSLFSNGYEFRSSAMKVKLSEFVCRPEGGGLAVAMIQHQGMDWLQSKRIAVVMLGHRNTTALYFEYGELKLGDSPLLGFDHYLKRVCELKSGLDKNSLVTALFDVLSSSSVNDLYDGYSPSYPRWFDFKSIQGLATAKYSDLRSSEISEISVAIDKALKEYWQKLYVWLKDVLPPSPDEVIISGGAGLFLTPDLKNYFSSSRITWGHKIPINSQTIFKLVDIYSISKTQQALHYRLIDVYGIFAYLQAINSSKKVA